MQQTFDVERVLSSLTLLEKISLLGGKDNWHTQDVPVKGIPSIRMSDGPNGVRGTRSFNETPSACYPCGTGLSASWDIELVTRVGHSLGEDCKSKSVHVLLGPTLNIQRSPLGGRGFESFSEDPYLSGHIASSYIIGVQGTGVMATAKHFVGNEQEYQRMKSNSIISVKALREIYLEPFRIAQLLARPKAYMTGYQRLNGVHVSEDYQTLQVILRDEWDFKGAIMSDWTGTYSTVESIKAGLDLEMPEKYLSVYTSLGPAIYRGETVMRSIHSGKLEKEDVDDRARNVLKLVQSAVQSGIPFDGEETTCDHVELRQTLREAAAAAVILLKNEADVLPLTRGQNIAVIGSQARFAVVSGGGSAALLPSYSVSPLEGIRRLAAEMECRVTFAMGTGSHLYLPVATELLSSPDTTSSCGKTLLEFWSNAPCTDWLESSQIDAELPDPVWAVSTNSASNVMYENVPKEFYTSQPYFRLRSTFTPDVAGDWQISIAAIDESSLYLDGVLLAKLDAETFVPGSLWMGLGSKDMVGVAPSLVAGKRYRLEIRSRHQASERADIYPNCGGIRVGAMPVFDDAAAIQEAIELAKFSDVAIVVVGLTDDIESEGFDRVNMELPGTSDKLISAVAKANPRTIVVNQSGMPVSMPWLSEVPAVVHAFYGGNEGGNGIADILFGNVNPSGKLPVTFPKHIRDSPSYLSFGIDSETDRQVLYKESCLVGYRYYDRAEIEPLFPFGHGLSYTSFTFSDLNAPRMISIDGSLEISFSLTNTGTRSGSEVAQVYVSRMANIGVNPVKQLKGFRKTALLPEETAQISIKLDRNAWKSFEERRGRWVCTPGTYEVLVGESSRSEAFLRTEVFLQQELTWTGL